MDNFAIIGAGFGGLCTAIYFKLHNIHFNIYESKEHQLNFGGSVTIFPNGMKILRELGVADEVIAKGACMHRARFSNQKGNLIGYYSMGDERIYGSPTITIQRSVLQNILLKKSRSMGISVKFGKKLTSLKQEKKYISLKFHNNFYVNAKYVIGADGIHSTVRKYICPKNTSPCNSNQVYIGGFISEKKVIDSFKLDRNIQYITVGGQSFFAYSIVDNVKQNNYNLLWYCYLNKKDYLTQKDLRSYSDNEILSEIAQIHDNWHSPISKLITNTQKIVKTNIYDTIGVGKWSNERMLIIGDSCHAIHPISGQGASFAMEDAQLLTFLLKKKYQPISDIFKIFAKIRSKRITPVAKKARRSTKFSSIKTTPLTQYIRDKLFCYKLKFIPERFYNRTLRYDLLKQNISENF